MAFYAMLACENIEDEPEKKQSKNNCGGRHKRGPKKTTGLARRFVVWAAEKQLNEKSQQRLRMFLRM